MLQGRDDEQAAVTAVLDGARDGRGSALVLLGDPGVGKSALLADAAVRAEGMTVLRTRGVESESPLAFAALHRLLRPVMRCADRLPEPQARALRTAFGEADGALGDRFLVFVAAMNLLAEAGEQAPVLAIVDDAHWLDDASAAALLFVARRLQVERVGLLFAARARDVRRFDSGDLPTLAVGGVDTDAAGRLLAERVAGPVAAEVRDALVAGTRGNPLALVELAGALSPAQLAGIEPLPARLPLTEGVERAFLDRCRRLPEGAQTVLLVAAADDSGRVGTVRLAAAQLGGDDDDRELLVNLGVATWYVGDDEAALRLQDRLLAGARTAGALVMILHALTRRAFTEIATGRWRASVAGATESLPLAESSGQPGLAALPHALLALLAAFRGSADGAEHLAAAERIAAATPLGVLDGLVRDLLRWARGLAGGRSGELHQLAQITLPTMQLMASIDRIEAAVRAGHLDIATDWLADLAGFAEDNGAAWAHAAAHHGRALLADGPAADDHFRRALEHHARSLRAPDRARTQLAYGEFLRRSRRRVDARVHLRAALETFEDLGAEPWAERARQELRASGETARRRDTGALPDLTPAERQIAGLVREGLSNRDIASRLFVSPRTVDFHLRNVFAKLGVSSRTELAAHLPD